MATPDEILASIDELNGHIDNQLKHFAPQLEALKAVRHSEAARTEGLQLEMEQRRLARGQAAPHSIPQAIQMQRQQLRAQLRALEQPGDGAEATAATEGEKEEGAQLLQSAASPRTLKEEEHLAVARLEAAAVELSMYNPNAGIQEQVSTSICGWWGLGGGGFLDVCGVPRKRSASIAPLSQYPPLLLGTPMGNAYPQFG